MFPKPLTTESDYESTLQFFEKLLRADSPCRLEEEYPLAFQRSQLENIFVIESDGSRQAGLTTLIREIEIQKDVSAKALFVGSVVTDPNFRNRGLQRQLFQAVEEAGKLWDVDFLVLWSNQLEFYEKIGFHLGGLQASWFCTHRGPIAPKKMKPFVGDSARFTPSEIHLQAFVQKPFSVRRTPAETARLFKIPRMIVAATDRAYALMGKGEDFEKVCHEWNGPADEVLSCIDALRDLEPQLRILSPGVVHDQEEQKVVHALEAASFENRLEYLGLFKMISKKISPEDLQPEDLKYPFFIWGLDSI